MMVSWVRTRAIAAEPVPAMMSPPSAPAWAPMQAVVASFAARTRRKPGKAAATRVWSLSPLNPASPSPMAIDPRSAWSSPAFVMVASTTARKAPDRRIEIDMDIRRRSAASAMSALLRIAQPGPGAGRRRRRRQGRGRAAHAAATDFDRSINDSRRDAERLRRALRRDPLRARAGRRLPGGRRQVHEDGGNRPSLCG